MTNKPCGMSCWGCCGWPACSARLAAPSSTPPSRSISRPRSGWRWHSIRSQRAPAPTSPLPTPAAATEVLLLLPQIGLRESWARSDDPVFAFEALLEQGRFTEADFDVAKLNDPAALDHFRTKIALEQPIFSLPAWYDRSAAGGVRRRNEPRPLFARGSRCELVESYVGLLLARDAVAVAEEAERAAAVICAGLARSCRRGPRWRRTRSRRTCTTAARCRRSRPRAR